MLPDHWWPQPELRRGRGEPGSRRRLDDVVARDKSAADEVVRMLGRLGHRQHGKDTSVDLGEQLFDGATRARGELPSEPVPKCRPAARVVLAARIDVEDLEPLQQDCEERGFKRPHGKVAAVRTRIYVIERRCGGEQVRPVPGSSGPARSSRRTGPSPGRSRPPWRHPPPDRPRCEPRTRAPRQHRRRVTSRSHSRRPGSAAAPVSGVAPDGPEHARGRDAVDVVAGGLSKRTVLTPPGHPAEDQTRVSRQADGGPEAQPFHDPGTVSLDQHTAEPTSLGTNSTHSADFRSTAIQRSSDPASSTGDHVGTAF